MCRCQTWWIPKTQRGTRIRLVQRARYHMLMGRMTLRSADPAPVTAMGPNGGGPHGIAGLDAACERDRFQRENAMPGLFQESGIEGPTALAATLAAIPILIVAYRNADDMVACLAALRHARTSPAFEVFVCENGGPEAYKNLFAALTTENGPCQDTEHEEVLETPLLLTRHVLRLKGGTDAPLVHLGEATENLGYAGGVNAWLRPLLALSGWPAVWILNPDSQPAPDALLELAAYADRWGKAMVGSRLVPTAQPDSVHSRGLAWCKGRAVTRSVDLRAPGDFEPDPQDVDQRIDSPVGASMYVTRACIERIGLMDERYFLLFEDLEWGLRAKRHFGVGYAHRSIVVHAGGTTMGSANHTAHQSALSVYLEFRNSILFVREKFPIWLPWTIMVQLTRILVRSRAYPPGNLSAALRGIAAGLRGHSGRPNLVLQRRNNISEARK